MARVISAPLPNGLARNVPNRIIVHSMAHSIIQGGRRIYAVEILRRAGFSAHVLVAADGTWIRCRRDTQGAFHARGYNLNSLGVEVLVPGVTNYQEFLDRIKQHGWVSQLQFAATVNLVRYWCQTYGIGIKQIKRHSDVAPGRKMDPGEGFPWCDFLRRVRMV